MPDFRSPAFWIETWKNLYRGTRRREPRGYASAGTWDAVAPSYGRDDPPGEEPDARVEKLLHTLERRGIGIEGRTILDVGCGHGRYAVAFARQGADVTALDFSPAMLDRLRETIPDDLEDRIHPVQADWRKVALEERGWAGAFDLAIANMTPAITSGASLLKLHDASRRWCFYRSWAGPRVHPLMDRLRRELGTGPAPDGSWNLLLAFNLLYTRGVYADVEFDAVSYERREPVEHVATFARRFFSGFSDLPEDELASRIDGILRSLARDGLVDRKTAGRTGVMTWRVDAHGN